MSKPFILYAWHLSYYSAKLRCYLLYKRIPFVEKAANLLTLYFRIRRRTGAVVMPVVVTPEGEWLQDSSDIIDRLEGRFPKRPVVPSTPLQRIAAYLLEAWGDEWWVPVAMYTRWCHAENYPLFEREGGRALLPGFPRFLKDRAVVPATRAMRAHLPRLGVVPEQIAILEDWTRAMLDHLDAHFRDHLFLLGDGPSLGDFGLVGSLYAHLGRDPWSKRELVDPRKHLRAWIDRMAAPERGGGESLLAGDRIPETLAPVLGAIVGEFLPMIEATLDEVRNARVSWRRGEPLPRAMGNVVFPMAGARFRRAATPFALWKMQRLLDVHRAMTPAGQNAVRAWLASFGGERLLDLEIPRLRRVALQIALE